MFKDDQAPPLTPEQEMLAKVLTELDEIKRYVAATYGSVDNEITEIKTAVQRIEAKLHETEGQIDRIQNFERAINDIKSSVQRIEREIK